MENDLIAKAKEFATKAHDGQTEKDEQKTPYIYHPEKVAELVTQSGGCATEIAAAWLHDVVEDTEITIDNIEKEFGTEVAHIVEGLTDLPGWDELPVDDRKQEQADRVLLESDSVKKVKLADQISAVELDSRNNLLSVEHRRKYIAGCKKIAENCKSVSEFLDDKFDQVYEEALRLLS